MKCPKCKTEFNEEICPNCGTRASGKSVKKGSTPIQKSPVPQNEKMKWLVICIFILMAIIIIILIIVLVTAKNENGGSSSSTAPSSSPSASVSSSVSKAAPNSSSQSSSLSSLSGSQSANASKSQSTDENTYALAPESAAQSASESAAVSSAGSSSQSIFESIFQAATPSAAASAQDDYSGSAISDAEYNQIVNGMTYEQVNTLTGGTGKLESEFGKKGDSFYTVRYRWQGYGSPDAYAECTFEDGKLNSKIQFGLK